MKWTKTSQDKLEQTDGLSLPNTRIYYKTIKRLCDICEKIVSKMNQRKIESPKINAGTYGYLL